MALLNKSRNRELGDRRLGRYFVYAVGEILIIIIGILAAIQIQNWNERKLAEQAQRDLFAGLHEEIEINLEHFRQHQEVAVMVDTIANRWINFEYASDPMSHLSSSWVGFRFRTFNPKQDQLKKALESSDTWPVQHSELLAMLSSLEYGMESIKDISKRVEENVGRNIYFLEENFPWALRRDSASTAKRLRFIFSDSLFVNRIGSYRILAVENVGTGSGHLRGYGGEVQLELDRAIGRFDDQKPFQYLGAQWSPAREIPEDSLQMEQDLEYSGRGYVCNTLIYNGSPDTVLVGPSNTPGDYLRANFQAIAPGEDYVTPSFPGEYVCLVADSVEHFYSVGGLSLIHWTVE